ncbi:hypothetical protein [Ammoniphilus sp. CFH 90114]|uniref:hypothetical protein n=1 Tax=Ammoniphilus sp. CFH 90114 TaxID=2493665 RepID=UPI00100EDBAB|nr:hypothetical protein [Ammoniphilus sp. CFH 90114]RXT15333.1 hypothetical protein EIZ39_03770 [Ammoniphilus sp. CFH 90114]
MNTKKIPCKSCGITLSEYEKMEYAGECIDCHREKEPRKTSVQVPLLKRLRNRKYMLSNELR